MSETDLNVIFLMDDQHHPEAISCLRTCPRGRDGKPLVETPNLNRLVSEGVRFAHAYTPTAICSPSRTCFYTGQYPGTHGQYGNDVDTPLDPATPSLLARFRAHGYRTGVFGKSHLPRCLAQDFEVEHLLDRGEYARYLEERGLSDTPQPGSPADPQFLAWTSRVPKEHSSEVWTAERALEFLEADQARPFFAWISFERPHAPHSPDAETEKLVDPERVPLPWDDYARFEQTKLQPRPGQEDYWKLGAWDDPRVFQRSVARYYSLIGLIDEQIGRILDKLEELGQHERTLIVFSPDHGDFGGDYGQLGKNVPVYEQLYKVPLLWSDPGRPQDRGKVVEGLWETIDVFPSLMERLGWETPARVQGASFLPALDGWRPVGKEQVFGETTMCKTLRTREYKLAFHLEHPDEGQLFEMLPRPDELHNRWSDPEYREIRERLTRRLLHHLCGQIQPRTVITDWEPLLENRYNRWLLTQPGLPGNIR